MNVTRPFAGWARDRPDDTAISFGARHISWRDLARSVDRLAAHIAAVTAPGSGIALDLPNGSSLVLLFLAVVSAGREAQIFDPDWPDALACDVALKLEPGLAVTSRAGRLPDAKILAPDLSVDELASALGAAADAAPVPEPDAALPFYVGFTSGSTGLPKGFRRAQSSWLASFEGVAREFGIGPRDVVFAPGPFSHSTPVYALANGLHAGARVVVAEHFQAHGALRLIAEQGVTVLFGVPAQLLVMLQAAEAGGLVFPAVRLVLSSGAKWPAEMTARLRRIFPDALFVEFYGASEFSFAAIARSDEGVSDGSVGRAFPGVDISIRDGRGRRLPVGRTGLVFVEGAQNFLGYVMGDGDVRRAGGALSVGDRGFLDARGFLHLTGRADRMVIASGRNVQPEEVERALERHPSVANAAVIGVPEQKRGVRLIAFIQPKGPVPGAAELVRYLRRALPPYKVPSRFAIVADWPRTRSGKTDFTALRRIWEAGSCEVLR